jgi:hypothetical protein
MKLDIKKVIIRPLIFFAILLGLAKLISILADPFMTRRYYYNETVNKILSSESDILVLGDSHVAEIIQDNEQVCNGAAGNESVSEFYAKLLLSLKNGRKFKYLVLECDYHILSEFKLVENNMSYLANQMDAATFLKAYPRYNILDFIYSRIGNYFTVFNTGNAVSFRHKFSVSRIKENIAFLRRGPDNPDTTGSTQHELDVALKYKNSSFEDRMELARGRIATHFSDSLSDELIRTYADIMRVAKENNIKVIGVTYPLAIEYRQLMPRQRTAKIDSIFNSMDFYKRYDYTSFSDNAEDFLNPDHMNLIGGPKFFSDLENRLHRDGIPE